MHGATLQVCDVKCMFAYVFNIALGLKVCGVDEFKTYAGMN